MPTEISPMLAVSDGNAAIAFYVAAFGAKVLWQLNGGGHVVAGLEINGAKFFLATESPQYGTRGPGSAGFTTVRIELFVEDPVPVRRQAGEAGARVHSLVRERAALRHQPAREDSLSKNFLIIILAVPSIRRWPTAAIVPPTCASPS